jgi:Uma2 family endonuclease
MAIAPPKLKAVPPRLLAALHRAGVSEGELRRAYKLDAATLVQALARSPEPLLVDDMDFVPDDGHRYELWEGELVRMSPTKRRHTDSTGMIVKHLGAYLLQHPLGEICVAEGGFRAGPNESLYCPDAGFVSHERRATVPLDDYYPFAPDIAIEVWSPDNTQRQMGRKVTHYLERGSRLVWVLRPQDLTVQVHRLGAPMDLLRTDAFLTGEDVLPGFSVLVRDLFPS